MGRRWGGCCRLRVLAELRCPGPRAQVTRSQTSTSTRTAPWLTIRRPGGRLTWFDGDIATTREWSRTVRAHRTLPLITGPFTSVLDFQSATTGRLFLLPTPLRVADGT